MDFSLGLVIQIAIIIASLVILGYLVHLFYFSTDATHFVEDIAKATPSGKPEVPAHTKAKPSGYVVLGLSAFIFLVQTGGIVQNVLASRKVSYR